MHNTTNTLHKNVRLRKTQISTLSESPTKNILMLIQLSLFMLHCSVPASSRSLFVLAETLRGKSAAVHGARHRLGALRRHRGA